MVRIAVLGAKPTISNIVLLVADQKTLDTFPELRVFWHKHYADAIRAAGEAGAKVIGLDLAFGVPVDKWEPDYDRLLGEAVSTSPVPVVCSYVSELQQQSEFATDSDQYDGRGAGAGGFRESDFGFGRFRAPSGVNRGGVGVSRAMFRRLVSLALRVVEKYVGADAAFDDGKLTLPGNTIPIDSRSQHRNQLRRPAGDVYALFVGGFRSRRQGRRQDASCGAG